MAELLVFTLLAAIAAAYQILPKHRQLRVRYSLWTKGMLGFIVLMFIAIITSYWVSLLVQSKAQNEIKIRILDLFITITSFHVESAQLVAVLLITIPFLILFFKQNVRIRNEDNLLEILRDLYNREQYATLVNLLQDNYRPLISHPSSPVHPKSLMWPSRSLVEIHEDQNENSEPGDDGIEDKESNESKVDNEETEELDKAREGQIRETRWRLQSRLWDIYERMNNTTEDWNERIQQKARLLGYYSARLRYRAANTAEDAAEYTETLLLDPDFTELYSDLASELGLEILRDDSLESFPRRDVVHRYLRAQLKTENTLLHRDLEQNTWMDGHRYKLQEENRLVFALFSDFERAENLDVYKPIGDQTREIIREQRREEFDKYHDQRLTDTRIRDDYIFRDPVFIGIQFFDVMVREAFNQEVDWHVWLSYYESFTREICRNYEITEYSDPDAEWPNDYSRLLWEMVSNMRDWIKMLEEELKPDAEVDAHGSSRVLDIGPESDGSKPELISDVEGASENECAGDEDQARTEDESDVEREQQEPTEVGNHLQLGRISTDRWMRNIPEMTVIVLFSCHEEILTTDEIPLQFMDYITESIFLCLLDLREYNEGSLQWKYSELMLQCLKENLTGRRTDTKYQENLKCVYFGDYGGPYDYGVRGEVIEKDLQMTNLADELDEIIDS